MPNTITKESHGYYRKFNGEIMPEEILTSNISLFEDPAFDQSAYIINDFRDITGLKLDERHTQVYASTDDIIANTKGPFKVALVINDIPTHLALAESYQQQLQNKSYQCKIFYQLDDARHWMQS